MIETISKAIRERTEMMSYFKGGGGGSKMTQKNRIIEGKNRIKGGKKLPPKIGHHLCMIP